MTRDEFLVAFAKKLATKNLPLGITLKPDEMGGLSGFHKARSAGPPLRHTWNVQGELNVRSPLVYISWLAHTKMWFYTMRCPVEIKWMLSCYEYSCEGVPVILVADAFLPPQTCSPGAVVVSATQDGLFKSAFFDDPETEHVPDTLWGAGHSHHRMIAYTSTDDAHEVIGALKHEERYLLRVITNKYCEMTCSIADAVTGEVQENVSWKAELIYPNDDLMRELERQFRENVTIAAPAVNLILYPIIGLDTELSGEKQ